MDGGWGGEREKGGGLWDLGEKRGRIMKGGGWGGGVFEFFSEILSCLILFGG